jgi:DNA-binding transcriptional LysR family regulator
MNLDRIRLFVKVAQLKNFSAAARSAGLSPAAVSKQVQLLEEELGVKLLHRTTRQVTLTEAGQGFFLRANSALGELTEAIEAAGEQQNVPKGVLRVGAPVAFGHMYLLPLMAKFALAHPEVQMDVTLDDRMMDPVAEGYDVVIRIGPLHDSTLVMKPLGLSPLLLVASHDYLKKAGVPKVPGDLKNHRMIAYSNNSGAFEWHYRGPKGETGHVRMEAAMKTNSADMMLMAARQGVGLTMLPKFLVEESLRDNKLVQVMPDYMQLHLRQVVALTLPGRQRTAKVQAFLKYLGELPKFG